MDSKIRQQQEHALQEFLQLVGGPTTVRANASENRGPEVAWP